MSMWLVGTAKLLMALQAGDAAVAGHVRDAETGNVIAGVVITLTDIGRATVSDDLGRYLLRSIPPGPQHLTVRRIGYLPRALHALVPRTGTLQLDIALRRDPVRLRSIEVRPPVAIRGADDAPGHPGDRSVSLAAIRNHPVLAEPDAFMALGGGAVVLRAESPSGVHIRGGSSDQTAYLLDGIPVFSPYHVAGTFSAFNPDALQRVDVWTRATARSPLDGLSGTVAVTTRTGGSRTEAQGSLTTTQARLTLDGPIGLPGSTYLVSIRTGFPGFIAPEREPSYLRGEAGDLVAKVEVPIFGGRGRVLVYDNATEVGASADASGGSSAPAGAEAKRHDFEWHSRSAGVEWSRTVGRLQGTVQLWSASVATEALWNAKADAVATLTAERRDVGVVASTVHAPSADTRTVVAVRFRRSRTNYDAFGLDGEALSLDSRLPLASLFIEHEQSFAGRITASLGMSATAASGSTFLGPQALLRWRVSSSLLLTGSFARSHQFAQSLRNSESIIGTVFPADLFVGASASGVPVARADNGVLAVELRPTEGVRLEAQGHLRRSAGLLLVAPRSDEPFTTRSFTTGAGVSRGVSLEGGLSATRYGVVASYGWQHVRITYDTLEYTPDHATAHLLEGGAIVFPSATASVRVGVVAAVGRRASGIAGSLETEACNLLDRGCELAGTPRLMTDALGASRLPPYLRVDIGARKHWDLEVAGRNATVALFATVTNVLARGNVLAVITDPATGEGRDIGMRPIAPLVVGVDWRF